MNKLYYIVFLVFCLNIHVSAQVIHNQPFSITLKSKKANGQNQYQVKLPYLLEGYAVIDICLNQKALKEINSTKAQILKDINELYIDQVSIDADHGLNPEVNFGEELELSEFLTTIPNDTEVYILLVYNKYTHKTCKIGLCNNMPKVVGAKGVNQSRGMKQKEILKLVMDYGNERLGIYSFNGQERKYDSMLYALAGADGLMLNPNATEADYERMCWEIIELDNPSLHTIINNAFDSLIFGDDDDY